MATHPSGDELRILGSDQVACAVAVPEESVMARVTTLQRVGAAQRVAVLELQH